MSGLNEEANDNNDTIWYKTKWYNIQYNDIQQMTQKYKKWYDTIQNDMIQYATQTIYNKW